MSAYGDKLKKAKGKLADSKIKPPEDPDAFGVGDAFDIAIAVGAAAAAIPSGGMSLAAIPAVLGTGMAAKSASEGIREGFSEGDAGKVAGGALQGAAAYSGINAAKTAAAQQLAAKYGAVGMEGMTNDEIDLYMDQEHDKYDASEAAKKKAWDDLPPARAKRNS